MRCSTLRAPSLVVAFVTVIASACGGAGGGVFDNTPPTVATTDPPSNAVGVQLNDPIIATFSEPLDPGSVSAASFQVTDDMSNPVNGTVSVSGRNARFAPGPSALVKSALYHAMLTTAIKDSAGNALTSGFNWDFMTTADMWLSTAVNASAPTTRMNHSAVWAGNEMIIWGGLDGLGVSNSGARYTPGNPAATAWMPTANTMMAGAPLARTDHTAVWNTLGNEMIVWGGELGGILGPTNSGGRYSVASNVWTATPAPPPAVPPRSLHTAIWTGGEMIIWGGVTAGGVRTSTGGRFNPIGGGSWTATSMSGPPSARSEHTAIWTGTEMIVWGGVDDGALLLQTGGRYRRSTNNWLGVSTVSALSARAGHTAIWTGSEMIIWGGDAGLGPVADGARYNPTADTWSPMRDAPIARSSHKAIWTGTEMIVWGGEVSDNSGAAYNPAHDTWRSVSIVAAPSGRTGHTAVWTGNEMIVWGGNDAALTNTGGRYAP
ncbi:MAG TPA: Ig-like domain-containing protein [Burkholderiales bacterium]